ncbi:flippase [Candidatus Daviesbacteria bacterium]|nr:flippase [Candidatus Daviesbacteria bacterium]
MKQILKQTSWLIIAQVLTKVIGFFYTIFLARNLGVSDFGLFTVALTYFSLVSATTDFGFNRFLIREIARDQFKPAQLIFGISLLRLMLTAVLFAVLSIFLYLFDPDKIRVSLTLLGVLAVFPLALGQVLDAIFIGFKKMQYSAIALVVLNASTAFLGIILINLKFGTIGAVAALILGQLVYLIFLLLSLHIQKIQLFSVVKTAVLKEIIRGSLPYGILGILGLIYFRVDILLLSYLRGNFDTGIYGIAYKFFEAVVFIPSALSTVLFPHFAKLHTDNLDQVVKLYFKSLKILFALSIVIVLAYILILPLVIQTFLPNYLPAISAIKILSIAIPFMFCHFPAASVLLSTDKYLKATFWLSLLMLSLNIALNLIFIPKSGLVAASWITVFSEALSFLIFFKFLMKNFKGKVYEKELG